jgi:hypothetical protein
MDTHLCGTAEDTYELALGHVEALQKLPFLSRAHFLWAPEDNTGHEGQHIYKELKNLPMVKPVCVKSFNHCGVWTGAKEKVKYAFAARHHVRSCNVQILDKLVCSNRKMKSADGGLIPDKDRPQAILDKLIEQLGRYKQIDAEATNPLQVRKSGISGVADKSGKVDPSAKDDLAFTFTMALGVSDGLRDAEFEFVPKSWLPD